MKQKGLINFICAAILISLLMLALGLVLTLIQMRAYPREYSSYVQRYAKEYNVPEYVVYTVIKIESDYDKSALSSVGACGLMQLMPETYSDIRQWK